MKTKKIPSLFSSFAYCEGQMTKSTIIYQIDFSVFFFFLLKGNINVSNSIFMINITVLATDEV